MKKVCIICSDKVFSRMIELELKDLGVKIKTISEKLGDSALSLVCSSCDIVILDESYVDGDMAFLKQSDRQFVVFSDNEPSYISENVTAFFERPFVMSHFMKHMRTLINNEREGAVQLMPETTGAIELDLFSKQATVSGMTLKFSPREFSLLSLLYKNRGKIVSRKEVLDTIWGKEYDESNNADNVYINYLRNKLDRRIGIKLIYTVRGKGYMMK